MYIFKKWIIFVWLNVIVKMLIVIFWKSWKFYEEFRIKLRIVLKINLSFKEGSFKIINFKVLNLLVYNNIL